MKYLLLLLMTQFTIASTPLLKKVLTSGFVPPKFVSSEVCEIFKDSVIKTKVINGTKIVTEKLILNDDLASSIESLNSKVNAKDLRRNDVIIPMDIPSILFYVPTEDGLIMIKELLVNGTELRVNNTYEASTLVSITNYLCQ